MTLLAPPSSPDLLSPPTLEQARSRSLSGGVLTSRSVVSSGSPFRRLDVLERLGKARHQSIGLHAFDRRCRNFGRECPFAGPLRRPIIADLGRGPATELSSDRALLKEVQHLLQRRVRERDVFRRWESGPGQ